MSTTVPEQPFSAQRSRAVLIEDDNAVRRSLQLLLSSRGFDVRSFGTASPFLADPQPEHTDLLVTDYRLPDGDGIGVLQAMLRAGWRGRSILITGFPSADLTESAKACGFDAVLEKPLRPNELTGAIFATP